MPRPKGQRHDRQGTAVTVRRRRNASGAGEQARRRHAWLELVQTSGPFLTLPVVNRTWPNGLAAVATEIRAELRARVARMQADNGASRHRLIEFVLRNVLDWDGHLLLDATVPDKLAELVVEHGQTVRPDFAFYVDGQANCGNETPGAVSCDDSANDAEEHETGTGTQYRLLGVYAPWGSHPLARTTFGSWTASPAERLAVLLRARDVPIGLVTDGRWWAIVWAPRGDTTGVAVFDASLFSEEPDSLAAFIALLERRRFLGVPDADTLPALLDESLDAAEEVTETLGAQVREAVELLVVTLDALDADSGRTLLADVSNDDLYAAAVTVLMRVVFCLFAEERRLLPSDDDRYAAGYGVGQLVETLEREAGLAGEQALEHRTRAWHRLLALSRAIHSGVAHEDLRMPAYGGSLFDPDRFSWLEGRSDGGRPTGTGRPAAVDDRTVLRMLRAVQYVEVGGERRRLTFRTLDVEQIGYVYEGLLELEVRTADEVILGMVRPKSWPKHVKTACEVPLSEARMFWESLPRRPTMAEWVAERSGWSKARLEKIFTNPAADQRRAERREALSRVIGANAELAEQIDPFLAVLRYDERGLPAVTLPGGRYVAPSSRRAATGTHYTPRQLAEDVASNALEPLVYRPGPNQTADRATWRLRPSSELLELRVADIAMGSGAFLVAACRYLADRLLEAWQAEGRADALRATDRTGRRLSADATAEQVLLDARRLVVEHCLYGVDVNPLAVEMGKLSLWLITMDVERPFDFLDDRLACGDSLLGLCAADQLENLHVDAAAGRKLHENALDFAAGWRPLLAEAADIRRQITSNPVRTIRDAEHKARLLGDARQLTERLTVVADAVTATGLRVAAAKAKEQRAAFVDLALRVGVALADGKTALRHRTHEELNAGKREATDDRRPLHWPLAFPEVLVDSVEPGFDAIIGNPPFLGGQKVSGTYGDDYLAWLQTWDGHGVKGSADLVARFVLRAQRLLSDRGQLGYVAVNTLSQGATLDVGLLQAVERGLTIRRATSSHPWPAKTANLEIVEVWASAAPVESDGLRCLDSEKVPAIGADLEPLGRVAGRPQRLAGNDDRAFIGSYVLGLGFTMSPEQASELIERDSRNADVLQPYVIGQDLNQRPDCSASRWVINFHDWPLDHAEKYSAVIDIVRDRVKPERDRNNRANYRDFWWRYAEHRPGLYETIADLDHVLALSLVSNVIMPTRVPTDAVFAHKCCVFALNDFASLSLLSSSVHAAWVIRYSSTMRTDINYSPSDVFDTLPRPESTPELDKLGRRLDEDRRALMLGRAWGLTTTYNHVHDPADHDPEIAHLRDLHTESDYAVLAAYGWSDLDPQIGHHQTKIGTRWTFSKKARTELLDRLLAENRRRHAAQQ
jgi:hypothetical protein